MNRAGKGYGGRAKHFLSGRFWAAVQLQRKGLIQLCQALDLISKTGKKNFFCWSLAYDIILSNMKEQVVDHLRSCTAASESWGGGLRGSRLADASTAALHTHGEVKA